MSKELDRLTVELALLPFGVQSRIMQSSYNLSDVPDMLGLAYENTRISSR